MKAAFITGINHLEIKEIPDPAVPENGVLVELLSAAICGTDVKMITYGHRDLSLPRIPGHEGAGAVVESNNARFMSGDIVAVYPGIFCGKCNNCLNSYTARCESIKVYGFNRDGLFRKLVPFTDDELSSLVPLSAGARTDYISLAEPLACCISACRKVSVKKESALIIGAGSVGSIFAALLSARGFKEVVVADSNIERLEKDIPRNAGVIEAKVESLESSLSAKGKSRCFDLIVPCCPEGLDWNFWPFMKPGGAVILFSGNNRGLGNQTVDLNEMHYRELVLAGSYGCNVNDFKEAVEMLEQGKIDLSFLSPYRASLEKLPECVEKIKNKDVKKIIINKF